jgi:cytochrome c oxidase cbb3-type subunit III
MIHRSPASGSDSVDQQPMLSNRTYSHLLALALLLSAGVFHTSLLLAQQHDFWGDDGKATVAPGQRVFNSNCSGCHGLDGRGGDKGPNIAAKALSDVQVSAIISNGIPGTGMPAFHQLGGPQVRNLISYLRILQGKLVERTLPGDPTRGKAIFVGKGECSNCHAISGAGGFLGPDLSAYGSDMPAKAIRDEIVRADRIAPFGYQSAVATTRDGDHLEGVIRNEDNFSVQLLTPDGSFHFLQKSDLQKVERPAQPLMPTNYSERLTPSELNDLVSYLMNAAPAPGPAPNSHKTETPTE